MNLNTKNNGGINRGIWLSLITPFDQGGKLDLAAAEKYVSLIDQYDFAGLLLGGSVGEGLLVNPDELASYIKITRAISKKPVMICIADFNYERACAKFDLDYDYLLITPCIYFKPHANAVVDYFKMIAKQVARPILLYNNPSRVGVNITNEIYAQVYDIENIIGMKECQDAQFEEFSNKYKRWQWFSGNDDAFLNEFFTKNENSAGLISTLANIAPKIALDIWQDMHDIENIQKWQRKWQKMVQGAYSIPNPQAVKIMLSEWGIIQPYFRAQFQPLLEFRYKNLFSDFSK